MKAPMPSISTASPSPIRPRLATIIAPITPKPASAPKRPSSSPGQPWAARSSMPQTAIATAQES